MIEFTAWPEMLAWPYLILKGWLPYKDIAIAHTPLMLIILTLYYKIVGLGLIQLKIFTWLLLALNTYLTFWVSKKIFDRRKGIVVALIYLVLAIYYQANGLWFDLALTPFALLLYYSLLERKYILGGLFFALGILTKQTFVYFLIPVVLGLINKFPKSTIDTKDVVDSIRKFIFGSVIVFLIFVLALLVFGLFDDFYMWAVRFGLLYLPSTPGQISLPSLKQLFVNIFPFVVAFVSPGLIPWVVAGIAGVYPRWELFHFLPALPFLAISIVSVFTAKKKYQVIMYLYVLVTVAILSRGIYRSMDNKTRFYENDVKEVVSDIRGSNYHNIYVVNYWDNIYALTDTKPVTKPLIPYIPWYLEIKGAKENIMRDLVDEFPDAFVVNDRIGLKWIELEEFIERYYSCSNVENKVELCTKNK